MKLVDVVVDNRVRLLVREIGQDAAEAVRREFTHLNPARRKLDARIDALGRSKSRPPQYYALLASQKREPSALATWREEGGELSVPRGGLARLRHVLSEAGVEIDTIDGRVEGTAGRHEHEHRVELWPFQEPVVDAILQVEQGIIRSPTGSGKTTSLIAAIARAGLPTLVVVTTTNLLDQWVRRFRVELGLEEHEVGVLKGSTRRVRPITVASQQTLWRCADEYSDAFGFVAVDEVHLSAAKTFVDVVDVFRARYRVGVSDDERRQDGKEFLIYDLFGARIAEVPQELPNELGFTLDVELRVVLTDFDAPWWHEIDPSTRPDRMKDLLDEMVEDRKRNELATSLVLAEVAQGRQVLAMTHRREHCHRLRAEIAAVDPRVGLMVGGAGADQREFERSVVGFLGGELASAVGTYQAVGTALDLPSVSRGVACTPIHKNPKFLRQVKGRICRSAKGKEDAVLYYLYDPKIFGKAGLANLVRWTNSVLVRSGDAWVPGKEFLKGGFPDA